MDRSSQHQGGALHDAAAEGSQGEGSIGQQHAVSPQQQAPNGANLASHTALTHAAPTASHSHLPITIQYAQPAALAPQRQQHVVSSSTSCNDDVVMGVPVAEYAQQWQAMAVHQQALMAWYGQAWLSQMHQGGAPMPTQGMGMLAHNQVSQMYQQLMSSQQQMATAIQQQQQQPPSHWMQPALPPSLQHSTHQDQLPHQTPDGSYLGPYISPGGSTFDDFGAAYGFGPGPPSALPPTSMRIAMPPTSSGNSMGPGGSWAPVPGTWPPPLPPMDLPSFAYPPGPWPPPPPPPPLDLPLPPDHEGHLPDAYHQYPHSSQQHELYGSISEKGMLGRRGMMDVVDGTEEGEELEEEDLLEGELGSEHSQGDSPASSMPQHQQPADRGEGSIVAEERGRRRHQPSMSGALDASTGGGTKRNTGGGGRRGERRAAGQEGQQAQSSNGGGKLEPEDEDVQQAHKESRSKSTACSPGASVAAGPAMHGTAAGARPSGAPAGYVVPRGGGGHVAGSGRLHPKRELSFSSMDPNAKRGRRTARNKVCKNCGTKNTPFWRKDKADGKPLCNACGLYFAKNESHRPKMLWKEDERMGLGCVPSCMQTSSSHAHNQQHGSSGRLGPSSGAAGPSSPAPRPGALRMPPSAYLVGLPPLPPALANFLAAAVAASGAVPGSAAAHAAAAAAASAITKMPAAVGALAGGSSLGASGSGAPTQLAGSAQPVATRSQGHSQGKSPPPPPPMALPRAPPPIAMPPASTPLVAPARHPHHPPAPPPAIAMPLKPPCLVMPPPPPTLISNPRPPANNTPPPAISISPLPAISMVGKPQPLPTSQAHPIALSAPSLPPPSSSPYSHPPPAPPLPHAISLQTAAPPHPDESAQHTSPACDTVQSPTSNVALAPEPSSQEAGKAKYASTQDRHPTSSPLQQQSESGHRQ